MSDFHLNGVGSEIFEMCKGKITVEKIVDFLSDKYKEIPREIIEDDVDTFLESLERNKCIVIKWDPL